MGLGLRSGVEQRGGASARAKVVRVWASGSPTPGEGGAPKRYLAATPEALAEAYATMAAVKRNVYEVITP